jgi:hypothetical protein
MINIMMSSIPWSLHAFWPSLLAVTVVAFLQYPASLFNVAHRKPIIGVTVLLSSLLCLAIVLHDKGSSNSNILVRDIVGIMVISLAAPLVTGISSRFLKPAGAITRTAISIIIGFSLIISSPYVLLLVHCTSGDCL